MEKKLLTIWDQEDLHYAAEEVITYLRYYSYWYDDDGNCIVLDLPEKERRALGKKQIDDMHNSYLCFRENEELRQISFYDALYMPLETIKEKYLKDALKKARNVLRKASMDIGYPVSDEVPDSYLDDLLALRWRENLKLWTMQWEQEDRISASENETGDEPLASTKEK